MRSGDPAGAGRLRLELGLVRVRWFGVALGALLTALDLLRDLPWYAVPAAGALIALLAGGNALVSLRVRRNGATARLGLAAFALDVAVIVSLCWVYSFEANGTTWVLLFVLPLEGALRYDVRGAMTVVAVAGTSEALRELARSGAAFRPDEIVFRVGIMAIVAMVAGLMARSLAEQTAKAERRSQEFEEVARRESEARAELAAFHDTVLAGIAAADPETAVRSMAETIAKHLGYTSLCILLVEGTDLRCIAPVGRHEEQRGRLAPVDSLAARAATEATPMLAPSHREMAAPMTIGAHVIGVIHVESPEETGLADLEVLTRLADQVALVAFHAQLQAERAETVARLRELAEAKSDFVAITSHELRTPLTGIRGFASILLKRFDELPKDEVREYIQIIDQQSLRLSRLVEDLLVVTKLDRGGLNLEPEEVSLGTFLGSLTASFADDAHRIALDLRCDGRPSFDPVRVEQVVRNLVHNALKFSKETVHVTASCGAKGVEFVVEDRGVGIPEGEVQHIFDRFHQAGNGHRRESEGVGLGLYITKQLVDAMGGRIGVESTPGRGTTFRVLLPAASPARA